MYVKGSMSFTFTFDNVELPFDVAEGTKLLSSYLPALVGASILKLVYHANAKQVMITFDHDLSCAQYEYVCSALQSAFSPATHGNPTNTVAQRYVTCIYDRRKYESSFEYQIGFSFVHDGISAAPHAINMVSSTATGQTYQIRIFDLTHCIVLYESDIMDNTEPTRWEAPFTLQANHNSTVEIHIKNTGVMHVHSMDLVYVV